MNDKIGESHSSLVDTIAKQEEIMSDILGKDHSRCVRGMGIGVNRTFSNNSRVGKVSSEQFNKMQEEINSLREEVKLANSSRDEAIQEMHDLKSQLQEVPNLKYQLADFQAQMTAMAQVLNYKLHDEDIYMNTEKQIRYSNDLLYLIHH